MSTPKAIPPKSLLSSLVAAGWHDEWMLREPMVTSSDGRSFSRLILRIGLYPVAAIETLVGGDGEALAEPGSAPEGEGLLSIGWDGSVATSIDGRATKWQSVPSPRQLWEYLGRSWSETDPRLLSPMVQQHVTLGLAQCLALGRILDAQLEGRERVRAAMPAGSGGGTVTIEACWRLLKAKRYRNALVVTDRLNARDEVLYRLRGQREVAAVALEGTRTAAASIEVVTIGYLAARGWEHLLQMERDRYDIIVVPWLKQQPSMDRVLEYFSGASLVGVHGPHEADMPATYGRLVYEPPSQDLLSAAEWQPTGTRRVWLDEIARVSHGLGPIRSGQKIRAVVVAARDVPADEKQPISLGEEQDVPAPMVEARRLRAGDIVLSMVIRDSQVSMPVAVIPELGDRVVIANPSLIIIRITDPRVDRREVVEHLRSGLAMAYFRANSESLGGYQRLTVRSVRRMPIFVRLDDGEPEGGAAQSPSPNRYAEALEALEKLGEVERPAADEKRRVAAALRQVLEEIEPPTLDTLVLGKYPTPIALAWRRYRDSRFNPYEHVLRLKDVFEVAAFFVYNVMLADHLRRLDPKRYEVKGDAKKAWKDISMVHRMAFVDSLLSSAAEHSESKLFLSHLAGTSVVGTVRRLQEFRNLVSHSATAGEAYQRRLVQDHEPLVLSLMKDLSFLADVRLVRMPSFFRRNDRMMRRLEIYRGVVPEVGEEHVDGFSVHTAAEHDHLVLLDADGRMLDLFPMYQLVESDVTPYERHLCFMKTAKGQKILGEDAHTALEVDLEGYVQLEKLQERHKSETPEKAKKSKTKAT